jgi:hypothetical protein
VSLTGPRSEVQDVQEAMRSIILQLIDKVSLTGPRSEVQDVQEAMRSIILQLIDKVSLTGPKSKSQEDTLRSIILQPKKYMKEAAYKKAELKSTLYQAIYTHVLWPKEEISIKKGLHKVPSGRGGEEEEEEEGDDEKKEQTGNQARHKKFFDALKTHDCDIEIIKDVLRMILKIADNPQMEWSNSDDKHLGDIVDTLLEMINAKEVSERDRLEVVVVDTFKLFFSDSQIVSEEPAEIDCHNFHQKFKCVQQWNKVLRRDNHDNGLVPNTPFCLWTALHLAMIDAGVPEMLEEMDRQKIKEQCLSFMLNDERAKQKTDGKFKKEFASMRFIIRKKSRDVQNFGVSEFYEVLL